MPAPAATGGIGASARSVAGDQRPISAISGN
jgi:hypothetical protein